MRARRYADGEEVDGRLTLHVCWQTLLEQIKVLLSGGKRTLPETTPTVGLNVSRCDYHGMQCQFWDLGGAEDLQRLWEQYYAASHAVLFVVDSTDLARMAQVRTALGIRGGEGKSPHSVL